jgi:superfamily II RNA helicase
MTTVITLSGDCQMPIDPVITFPYEPDNWQKHAFNSIEKDHDILINVPTSGGKTTVAIYAIIYHVKILKKKVIYTTPIKSLSNEKYNEFTQKFGQYGITVGILTGDTKINPDADIILCTAEILHNSLFQSEKKDQNSKYNLKDNFVPLIGCVIMDEVHYMNDSERGRIWEITIIMLPKSIQLIMLSGTIGNKEYFCNWINNCRERNIALIYESKRIVPLYHNIYVNKKLYEYYNDTDGYKSIVFHDASKEHSKLKEERKKKRLNCEQADLFSLIHYLKNNDMLQAIIFAFSQRKCEEYASMVQTMNFLDIEQKQQVNELFRKEILNQRNESGEYKYQNIKEVLLVKGLLDNGIAYHHAGMLQPLRELIEKMMKNGLIKLLFATETLCIGVNVPAKTCVFTDIYKPTKNNKRIIYASEYRQMGGRAGRRGLDIHGNVIFLPLRDFPYEEEFKTLVMGKNPDIKSNFRLDYQFMLKLSQITQFNIFDLFERSLMNAENLDQIKQLESLKLELNLEYEKNMIDINENLPLINDEQKNMMENFVNCEKIYCESSNIRPSKKQEQELKNSKIEINNNIFMKKYYLSIKQKIAHENKYEEIERSISIYNTQILNKYNNYRKNLEIFGYIKESTSKYISREDILIQGLICSQINECNVIILTEMIHQNYFNELSIEEIIALLSIFTNPVQKDNMCGPHDFDENKKSLHTKINLIIEKISIFEKIEMQNLSEIDRTEFCICTDYIDMSYDWGSGKSVHDILWYVEEYNIPIAAFCKNMVKLSNIIQTTLSIYNMIGINIELIPKFEEANKRVMRDIVCTQSLYL